MKKGNFFLLFLFCLSQAFASTAQFAYVSNGSSGTVSIIDTATNTVVSTLPAGHFPNGIAITPNGRFAYVAIENDGFLKVIDTSINNFVGGTISLGGATSPHMLAITPNGQYVYVADRTSSNTVSVVQTSTNTLLTNISGFADPNDVAISPDGTRAYVTNRFNNTVSVIDTSFTPFPSIIATIGVGMAPQRLRVTPDGLYVYETNLNSGNVYVIRTSDNMVASIISLPSGSTPVGVAITPNGRFAYVANGAGLNSVSVIDTSTNTVVTTIPVGTQPYTPAITSDGRYVYVTNNASHNVSVIDTSTNTVIDTINVGNQPDGIAITPVFSLHGEPLSNRFVTQIDHINRLTWLPVYGAFTYKIYRNGVFIAEVDGETLCYLDHNRTKGGPSTYVVKAFTLQGDEITETNAVVLP